ncbi:protein Wnt-1 [Biomphalaria glabrata]|nr:protein Wnt-1 [Biomphalaria glabrata]
MSRHLRRRVQCLKKRCFSLTVIRSLCPSLTVIRSLCPSLTVIRSLCLSLKVIWSLCPSLTVIRSLCSSLTVIRSLCPSLTVIRSLCLSLTVIRSLCPSLTVIWSLCPSLTVIRSLPTSSLTARLFSTGSALTDFLSYFSDIREAAFVYASTAAGVVYAVTNACSTGLLHQCTCDHSVRDRSTDGEWEWGGCGDNVEYGYRKSREFMDARKRKQRGDFTAMIQLHNNEAGRLAVKNYMRKECKCHGLSGSCALKTCWRKMPPFRDVGNRLKERFDGAIKVIISNDGNSIIPDGKDLKSPSKLDLVYSDTSPDFCKKNKKLGSLGTKGRECDPESPGVGGCDLLCCNRGYSKEQVTVMEYCKCRFHWCCEVICDTCEVTKILNRCK